MSKQVAEVKRGRPGTVSPLINKHIIQFRNKTPHEFVEYIFPEAQKVMKGGVTTDPETVKNQRVALYQSVIRSYKKAVSGGKKVQFQGRVVAGVKKNKWIHKPKADQVALVS